MALFPILTVLFCANCDCHSMINTNLYITSHIYKSNRENWPVNTVWTGFLFRAIFHPSSGLVIICLNLVDS